MRELSDKLKELIKALEAGNYNAKPTKLRQGSISAIFYDKDGKPREGTEEEWDALYDEKDEHINHGVGTAENGPDDPDCPCRGTPKQKACSRWVCGFCKVAEIREEKAKHEHDDDAHGLKEDCPDCIDG